MDLTPTLSPLGRRCTGELCAPRVVTMRRARSGRALCVVGCQRTGDGLSKLGLGHAGIVNSCISQFPLGFQIKFQFKFIFGLNLFKFCSNLDFGLVIPSFEFK
jgi:hypothetical protein